MNVDYAQQKMSSISYIMLRSKMVKIVEAKTFGRTLYTKEEV